MNTDVQDFFHSHSIRSSSRTDLVNYYIKNENIDIDCRDIYMWIEVDRGLHDRLKAKGETVVEILYKFWWGYKEPFRLYTEEQIRSQTYIGEPVSENKKLKEIYNEIYGENPVKTLKKEYAVLSTSELRHICVIYSILKRDGEKRFEHIAAGVSSAWVWLNENKVDNGMWEYYTWHYYQPFHYLLSPETIDMETKINIKDLLIFEEEK